LYLWDGEFIQVLRLIEDFHQHQVELAVSEAQIARKSAISSRRLPYARLVATRATPAPRNAARSPLKI